MLFKILIYLIIILIGTYVIVLGFLFYTQEKLIFLKVQPNHLHYQTLESFSEILRVNNDISLQGWKVDNHTDQNNITTKVNNNVIIYFGGNAQDVSSMLSILEKLYAKKIYTFNHRGYGLSEGNPSEDNLYSDALNIYDHVKKDNHYSNIIVIGHSLGSAVAGHLAKNRQVSRLILVCPLDSLERIAKERFYAPNFLIKHKFKLSENAKGIYSDSLIIFAENDSTIPMTHSEKTFTNLAGKKQKYICRECGHNDIFSHPETIKQINTFLSEVD